MSKTNSLLKTIKQGFSGNRRISSGLVTLSSAAILAIYAAGYEQTRAAADRYTEQSNQRLASAPVPSSFEPNASAPRVDQATSNRPPEAAASPSAPVPTAPAGQTSSPSAASVSPQIGSSPAAVSTLAPANAVAVPATVESPEVLSSKPEVVPAVEPVAVVAEKRAVEPVAVVAAAAPAPVPPPVPPPVVRQSPYMDGTFQGWGTSRHGDIQVSVVIQDGRIASAAISQCRTRYPCSWIAQLPGQVVSRQAPSVDYVSGATQSVNAYYQAVVEALALSKAK